MAGWREALRRTRDAMAAALRGAFAGGASGEESRESLEEALILADVPAAIAGSVVRDLPRAGGGAPRERLAAALEARLTKTPFDWTSPRTPLTVLIVGVNGSGKTTTCAKLALAARRAGRRPLLCAGDTYRAAGSSQMKIWAERLGIDVVAGATGADAAATAYDAMEAACARGADPLILDTAGRMHTRQPLMEELRKIRRALDKRRPGAPDETWIVLDAALGRNALAQARQFHDATPLTGVIVSKLDGSAKAGFVFAIAEELGLPVRYAGLGEGADDLAVFEPRAFVRSLLELDDEAG
jgi:fused signal recognition particle receptor